VASYADLQMEHQALLARLDRGEKPAALLEPVRSFIARATAQSANISSARDRDQLRANLRFWGSFVFDHAGVYPDTTLRPGPTPDPAGVYPDTTLRPSPTPEPATGPLTSNALPPITTLLPAEVSRSVPRAMIFGLGCLGLIILVGLLVLAGGSLLNFVNGPGTGVSSTPPATATPLTSRTPGPGVATQPTEKTPGPALTQDLTETQLVSVTLTASTQPAGGTATSTPDLNATATATSPATPAGGLSSLMLAEVTQSDGRDCNARTVNIRFDGAGRIPDGEMLGALVELRRAGSRDPDAAARFTDAAAGVTLRVEGFDNESSEPALLSVNQPPLAFSSVVLQFGAGCTDNLAEVRYVAKEAPAGLEAAPADGDLELGWTLVTWGPAPQDPGAWVAQLQLFARGGDDNFIFWDGAAYSTERPDILLSERACTLARRLVGVSSAGRSVLREIILQTPYCPAPQ
jgi:hypothetical protein